MTPILSLLILALAVSLDGFGVGAMYGLRRIAIPWASLLVISTFSGLVILVSMKIGVLLASFVSPNIAKDVGAVILIGIGIWAIFQMIMQKEEDAPKGRIHAQPSAMEAGHISAAVDLKKTVWSIELKRLGIIIHILRTPAIADRDRSGVISPSEAALLGLALSLDAFGAGIGAALIGFAPLLTAAVICLSSGLFIAAGLRIGFRFADLQWVRRLSILPGCILIVMGIMKLL